MHLFLRYVSSKAIETITLDDVRVMAVEVACLVEETFSRTILTSQLHLIVHLVDEIALCGTVHARWMFFLERFMKTLKDFVRQSARPEGSMAEGLVDTRVSCIYFKISWSGGQLFAATMEQ